MSSQESSGLQPTGPSQPTQQQGYETAGNPASQKPSEQATASAQSKENSTKTEQRVPTKQTSDISEATGSSLGRGIHGAPPGEEQHGGTDESMGRHQENEGEQMRAPGEGEINSAVDRKPGATGEQEDMASDLDKKKREQAPARDAMKQERQEKVDVGGILGQRGGPANPVN